MATLKKIILLICSVSFLFAFTACERQGPAERAGENIDKATEEVGEKIEETGEKLQN